MDVGAYHTARSPKEAASLTIPPQAPREPYLGIAFLHELALPPHCEVFVDNAAAAAKTQRDYIIEKEKLTYLHGQCILMHMMELPNTVHHSAAQRSSTRGAFSLCKHEHHEKTGPRYLTSISRWFFCVSSTSTRLYQQPLPCFAILYGAFSLHFMDHVASSASMVDQIGRFRFHAFGHQTFRR